MIDKTMKSTGESPEGAEGADVQYLNRLGSLRVSALIRDIVKDDRNAIGELFAIMQPWIRRERKHFVPRRMNVDDHALQDAETSLFLDKLIPRIQRKTIKNWGELTAGFRQSIRVRYRKIVGLKKIPSVSIYKEVSPGVPMHETILSRDLSNATTERQERLREGIEIAMRTLTDLQRRVVDLLFLEDIPVANAAEILGVSTSAITQVEERALIRLRNPVRSRHLEVFLFGGDSESD